MEGLKLVPQLEEYAHGCKGCRYRNWSMNDCPKNEVGGLACYKGKHGYIWAEDDTSSPEDVITRAIPTTNYQPEEPTKTTGTKHDSDKPRFDLVPPDALLATTRVITYGENKYPSINGVQNWRLLDNVNQRLFAAAQRHLWAYQSGEKIDESGENHLAHAISSLMFMLQLDIENKDERK